ncbi:MAG: hypothetical protein AB7L36_05105 [Sphingomonadaceae bacterium]
MSTDREALRLQDIIENIDRIESYVERAIGSNVFQPIAVVSERLLI